MCKTWIVDDAEIFSEFTKSILINNKEDGDIIEEIEPKTAWEALQKGIYPNILILNKTLSSSIKYNIMIRLATKLGTKCILMTNEKTRLKIPILKKPLMVTQLLKAFNGLKDT